MKLIERWFDVHKRINKMKIANEDNFQVYLELEKIGDLMDHHEIFIRNTQEFRDYMFGGNSKK